MHQRDVGISLIPTKNIPITSSTLDYSVLIFSQSPRSLSLLLFMVGLWHHSTSSAIACSVFTKIALQPLL
jgi:hypothetical protein